MNNQNPYQQQRGFNQQQFGMNNQMNMGIGNQMMNQQMHNPQQQQMYNQQYGQQQQMYNQQQQMYNQQQGMMGQNFPQQQMMMNNFQPQQNMPNQQFSQQGMMNQQRNQFNQPQMNQPVQNMQSPSGSFGTSGPPPNQLRPTLFEGLRMDELPLWPIKEEDLTFPQPQLFQKPEMAQHQLPQGLANDITQNEVRLCTQALVPLQELTGQQFSFFCDYHEFLMSNTKYVTQQQIPKLSTILCGQLLPKFVKSFLHWLEDIRKNSHPDIRWIVKKFLQACPTRAVTFKMQKDAPKDEPTKNGRMEFRDGYLIIWISFPGTQWENASFDYGNNSIKNGIANHFPFRAIENALDERGMIESQVYFQKHSVKKYLDAQRLLSETFGCEFQYEFDAPELFRNLDKFYSSPNERRQFFLANYIFDRMGHKNRIVDYFVKMCERLISCVKVNGVVDPKLVSVVLQKIPAKTIVLRLESLKRKEGYYHLGYEEGKLVCLVHYWYTNMQLIFAPDGQNVDSLESSIIIEDIPVMAYKNYHEKAVLIEKSCMDRLEGMTGKKWEFTYNFKLTYRKLLATHPKKRLEQERFPTVLMEYIKMAVDQIEKFNDHVNKLTPSSEQNQIVDDEDLDSEEEEEVRQDQQALPFTLGGLLDEAIPTRTIQVKFLNKLKQPLERYVFCELRDGKLVIKIIQWYTNIDQTLNSEKTSFGNIMTYHGAPLFLYLDYFDRFAKQEMELKEQLKKSLGTPGNWTFEYSFAQIYQQLSTERNNLRYAKQLGTQFGEYYKRVVGEIVKQNEGSKANFLSKFGQKRIIKLIYEPKDGRRGYTNFEEDQGVLVVCVKAWMTNVSNEVQKLKEFF